MSVSWAHVGRVTQLAGSWERPRVLVISPKRNCRGAAFHSADKFALQRMSRTPSTLHAEPGGPAPPVGRVSSQPAGPPPTSNSPAAPRPAPLSHSVNIYWASRLRAQRLLPHHRTSKFPKVEPQRRAGVWPRGPCSGCCDGGGAHCYFYSHHAAEE